MLSGKKVVNVVEWEKNSVIPSKKSGNKKTLMCDLSVKSCYISEPGACLCWSVWESTVSPETLAEERLSSRHQQAAAQLLVHIFKSKVTKCLSTLHLDVFSRIRVGAVHSEVFKALACCKLHSAPSGHREGRISYISYEYYLQDEHVHVQTQM